MHWTIGSMLGKKTTIQPLQYLQSYYCSLPGRAMRFPWKQTSWRRPWWWRARWWWRLCSCIFLVTSSSQSFARRSCLTNTATRTYMSFSRIRTCRSCERVSKFSYLSTAGVFSMLCGEVMWNKAVFIAFQIHCLEIKLHKLKACNQTISVYFSDFKAFQDIFVILDCVNEIYN